MIRHNERGDAGTLVLTWIAIILAVIALILGWSAFNRTGTDLESRIQQEVGEAVDLEEARQNDQADDQNLNTNTNQNNSGDTNGQTDPNQPDTNQ